MAAKKKEIPSEGKIIVFIPRANRDDTQAYVSVNGHNAVIRKGEAVTVPAPIAWALRSSAKEEEKAEDFIEKAARI